MKRFITTLFSSCALVAGISMIGCAAEEPEVELTPEESADMAEEDANAEEDAKPLPPEEDEPASE